jgi:toxin YoeB
MAKNPIIWSPRAFSELQSKLQYFNDRNGNNIYSSKLPDEIEETLKILSANEWIGRPARDKKLRILHFRNYSIIYEVQENLIKLHSFWDDRQNPRKSIK